MMTWKNRENSQKSEVSVDAHVVNTPVCKPNIGIPGIDDRRREPFPIFLVYIFAIYFLAARLLIN